MMYFREPYLSSKKVEISAIFVPFNPSSCLFLFRIEITEKRSVQILFQNKLAYFFVGTFIKQLIQPVRIDGNFIISSHIHWDNVPLDNT
jgi:hypothetical protein